MLSLVLVYHRCAVVHTCTVSVLFCVDSENMVSRDCRSTDVCVQKKCFTQVMSCLSLDFVLNIIIRLQIRSVHNNYKFVIFVVCVCCFVYQLLTETHIILLSPKNKTVWRVLL